MKSELIFIGDIKKCTKYDSHNMLKSESFFKGQSLGCDSLGYIEYEDELYKKDAILVKTNNGRYVDLENLNNILDMIKLHMISKNDNRVIDGLMLDTTFHKDGLFVDNNTLRPYNNLMNDVGTNISLKKLKANQNK